MSIKNNTDNNSYVDMNKVLKHLLRNWYWFAVSLVFCFVLAFVSIKVLPPKYLVSSSIYIKEDVGLEGQKAMEFIQSFNLFDQKKNYQNEMLILKSSPIIRQTIKQLNLKTAYYVNDHLLQKEIYKESPFVVMVDSSHQQIIDTQFEVVFKEDGQFILSANKDNYRVINYSSGVGYETEKSIDVKEEFFQSEVIEGEDYKFRIYLNEHVNLKHITGKVYAFKLFDVENLVRSYQNELKVNPVNPEVSVVQLALKSASPAKGVDFIHTLTEIYLNKNLERKNHLAYNTIAFINSQLEEISDSLSFAENNLEEFRASNQVMDITTKATRVMERLQQLEIQKSTTERAYNYYEYLDDYFQQDDDYSNIVVPSSMGVTNVTLNEFIRDLLILSNQRNDLIARKQQKGPFFKNLEIKIENLRNSIVDNIIFSKESLKREVAKFQDQINQLEVQVKALPKTERKLVGMQRKFNINDAIYTFLLQKRAEAQIAKAGNLPEHLIVEPARMLQKVFPNPKIHFALAFFLGLVLPAMVLVLMDVIDDRIKNEQAFTDKFSDLPFLGSILKSEVKGSKLVVHNDPTSVVTETFRTIRTNLSFFKEGAAHKTILVSSCIAGEGKSFVANNLGISLANLGKRTVIVGYDLRKSGQFSDFIHDKKGGLTSYYLKNKEIDEIIIGTEIPHLDFIAPGVIPPNPLELIGNELTANLFQVLKANYDYIIIDTPPIGVLSDGFMLMKYADVNIFVVREKYTSEKVLVSVLQETRQKGIQNIGLVLNGSKLEGKKYKYDYYNKYNNA
ncbi:GumC family protein [Saccharicrinis fermentans]|uniref:non-specific protein-tyrosine kinase n=1 Tax=Saccharicrinis fermentans DSM 9555 = JCM 21142 TaxID=869213 RepID=W7YMP1_9BACT|nr:tyrosine-protein kinase [Saccharicrinis fermentans]GAF03664.1 tyrosine-protein kinase ptk [Saccharicrinis fermentans DSM 9555 = JCM 21142]